MAEKTNYNIDIGVTNLDNLDRLNKSIDLLNTYTLKANSTITTFGTKIAQLRGAVNSINMSPATKQFKELAKAIDEVAKKANNLDKISGISSIERLNKSIDLMKDYISKANTSISTFNTKLGHLRGVVNSINLTPLNQQFKALIQEIDKAVAKVSKVDSVVKSLNGLAINVSNKEALKEFNSELDALITRASKIDLKNLIKDFRALASTIGTNTRNLEKLNNTLAVLEALDVFKGVNTSLDDYSNKLKEVNRDHQKLIDTYNKMDTATEKVDRSNKSLLSTLAKFAGAYIGINLVTSAFDKFIDINKYIVETASTFEKLQTQLISVEGSSYKASQSFEWIKQFARDTPMTMEDVTKSFVRLKAYGIEPTNGMLRTLGDTASALGKPAIMAVEAIADAVVGEEERLKEFGIKAEDIGDQIKYTWLNNSNQLKTITISDNQAMIASTLEAIFNSKYAGGMELMSQTWEGTFNKLKDTFSMFVNNIGQSGLLDYLKAIVTSIDNFISKNMESSKGLGKQYAEILISFIESAILSAGKFYDFIMLIPDLIGVLPDVFSASFTALEKNFYYLGSKILPFFASVSDSIIDSINGAMKGFTDTINKAMNSTFDGIISKIANLVKALTSAFPGISSLIEIGQMAFSQSATLDIVPNFEIDKSLTEKLREKGVEYALQYSDLNGKLKEQKQAIQDKYDTVNSDKTGENFAKDLIASINEELYKIQAKGEISLPKTNFGNDADVNPLQTTPTTITPTTEKEEVSKKIDEVKQSTNNLNSAFDGLIGTTGEMYGNIYNLGNTSSDTSDTMSTLSDTIDKVADSANELVFQFKTSFIDILKSQISGLSSIFGSTTNSTKTYQSAFNEALALQKQVIANPLSKTITDNFKEAYDTFNTSASSFLGSTSNFTSEFEKQFATKTYGLQVASFQTTARSAVDVLDTQNNLLEAINNTLDDGVLTTDESKSLTGLSNELDSKNKVLFGQTKFYDNLPIVNKIGDTTYYDNTSLAKDNSLIGTNSVADFINKLRGNATTGITLGSIVSTLPSLAVSTGLDPKDLSNISTQTEASAVANKYTTVNNKTSLKNTQLKQSSTTNTYDIIRTGEIPYISSTSLNGTPNWSSAYTYSSVPTGQATTYDYYAKGGLVKGFANGGFTGSGHGSPDKTGQAPAGVVHANEYVIPSWQVKKYPQHISQLEAIRQKGYADGGNVSSSASSISVSTQNTPSVDWLFKLYQLVDSLVVDKALRVEVR